MSLAPLPSDLFLTVGMASYNLLGFAKSDFLGWFSEKKVKGFIFIIDIGAVLDWTSIMSEIGLYPQISLWF